MALGVNRQALGNGLIVAELFYDGRGLSADEFDHLLMLIGRTSGPVMDLEGAASTFGVPGEMRRGYLHVSYTHTGARKWKLGLVSLTGLEDGSGYLKPSVEWSAGAGSRPESRVS